jgi:class 3 adenylate cyclase
MTPARTETSLLVAFIDLTRFKAQVQSSGDTDVADTLDAYYELVAQAVSAAGGTLVKFIGDAALIVFAEDRVDAGVAMLLELKDGVDEWMAARHWECRLNVKAHYGPVVAGPMGARGDKRFDVIGRTVNTAAILQSQGVTLSAEAFRQLSPELRRRFKKHTPPITYIRGEDPRPVARR